MPVEAGTDFPKADVYLPMEIETSAVVSPMFSLAEKSSYPTFPWFDFQCP